MNLRYLAFDIGCLECGEPSAVVGLFDDLARAQTASASAFEKQKADWHGEHRFLIFDLEDPKSYWDTEDFSE